jgi:GNAT superfamily N-acetyltransferase
MPKHLIRSARPEDCAELVRLAGQLGYPASAAAMAPRLKRLLESPIDVVYVAEAGGGALAGWIHGVMSQFLESDYRVEIGGLVVDECFQRKGIASALVKEVERWAAERGAVQVSVRCQVKRTEAHLFYKHLGFDEAKTQIVFRKPIR